MAQASMSVQPIPPSIPVESATTTATASEDALNAVALSSTAPASRWGLWALLIFLGAFIVWAAFAPLDEGVPAHGSVALDTKRKAVQHLSGGIIEQVLVHEGQQVEQGQLLIKLDDAVARANRESVRQRYLGLRAMQGRLEAEQRGAVRIRFHPDLLDQTSDPLIAQQMRNQEQLFATRRSLLQSDLQSIEQSIQGQEGLLQGYAAMLENRQSQLRLLNEELTPLRELVAQGYAPRNRQLELQRQLADTHSAIADLQGNTIRAKSSIGELRQRALSRQRDWMREVETQLTDVNREVQSDAEKIQAVDNDLERTQIKAPASGQVVGLAVQTVGGVVQPGQKLMDIVPAGAPLLLEVRVEPHMIDRVQAGLPVNVRFSTFAHSPQLVVQGEVISISRDALAEQQGAMMMTYYLARVQVTPEGAKELGQRQLQPGMPVEVVFKTGERSLLTYLLHPLVKRVAASMNEE